EESGVPADAQVVGHTWRFLNKDGSPDRRFNNNRRIPKCQYSQYHFLSATGINEIITTSKLGHLTILRRSCGQSGNANDSLPYHLSREAFPNSPSEQHRYFPSGGIWPIGKRVVGEFHR